MMRETILKFALAYAAAGLPTFPLNGKIPATRHGLKDASTVTASTTHATAEPGPP